MKFSSLTFIVTDDCNFCCSYCRPKKEKKYMTPSTIEKAITFFYPFLSERVTIEFYGGEPLLAFDSIKHTVLNLNRKNKKRKKEFTYSITTNCSLLTEEVLHFFDLHHFALMLSFDALTQDSERKQGTRALILELIRGIQKNSFPGIQLSINSVFTPVTVNYLSSSLQYIIELGVPDVQFTLANSQPWNEEALLKLEEELGRLSGFLVSYFKENRSIPLINFRGSRIRPNTARTFCCDGGHRRLAIGPEEDIWGCLYFHDYLKDRKESKDFNKYWFGTMEEFMKNHKTIYPRILANHNDLRQDYFSTGVDFCFICENKQYCNICPVDAAFATDRIGIIPSWICHLIRVLKKGKYQFIEEIDRISLSRS